METGLNGIAAQEQVDSLRETLLEAEDICRAIRHGEVDAVVAGKTDEEKRVLLMSGAYVRYRQIVEDMRQGAVTLSAGGEILFVNQAFARMLGAKAEDLFRTPLWRWVAQADHAPLQNLIGLQATRQNISVTLVRRDRKTIPAHVSLVNASDDFITLIVTDLGEQPSEDDAHAILDAIRRGAVDAFVIGGKEVMVLDSAKSPYRTLVEHMRQGAATVGPDGMVVFANERFCAMVGKPHGRVLATELVQFVADADRSALTRLLAGRDGDKAELRLRGPNGMLVATQATITPIDDHKLLLFSDVTERKRHQASDELTRKFLGMLAHEFRNILGPIANSVETLRRTRSLDAEGHKSLDVIDRSTARLLALVEDLGRVNPRD